MLCGLQFIVDAPLQCSAVLLWPRSEPVTDYDGIRLYQCIICELRKMPYCARLVTVICCLMSSYLALKLVASWHRGRGNYPLPVLFCPRT